MRKILVVLTAMLLISVAAIAASADDNGKEKVRVIAHTDKEISDAIAKGCKVVREAKTLKALVCSKDAATSLGLQEDIKVFAVDAIANAQIRADLVQAYGNNGAGRKIVVLDTGYNYNHQELSSSYRGGKDFVNDDLDPMDDNGHGSHVAGIITADGVYPAAKGVAPATGIIAGKVLSASGVGYFSDVVAAIYWAVDGYDGIANNSDDFNADAISMSLGSYSTYYGFCDNVEPWVTDVTNAISYAVNRGVIVVVAAGNSGGAGVSIPGCISYSTTVGAVDSSDNIADFSGIGDAVDITAPGVDLLSSWLGSNYAVASGTSMATPMVSGVVALIKFAHPDYTVAQVQDSLFQNAIDLGIPGKDSTYGWGRVDAYAAVAPPVVKTMHVAGIAMSINTINKNRVRATTTVTVVDESGAPVQGAAVSGKWSGLTSDADSGFTDASGTVTLSSDPVRKASGTFTFTVTKVEKTGWVYNQSENMETSDSITV